MFGSTILDLAFGLVFTFLMISLVTSATTEALASAIGWRANTLLQGIKDLLNDQEFKGLALGIYNHALVNPQANGGATSQTDLGAKPSYIGSKQFASAFIDITKLSAGATVPALQAQIDVAVKDTQLNKMLKGIVERAGGNISRVRDDIAAWFDGGMERVAGVYKRKTQLWSLIIALLLVVALNVDTIKISETLWKQPILIKAISPSSSSSGMTALDTLKQFDKIGLPYGWDGTKFKELPDNLNWLFALVGWLITAIATLFGAPFWFDALQKFVQLRGAGSK
jgi:hypothetical protein